MKNPTMEVTGWMGDPKRGASFGRSNGNLNAEDMPPKSIKIELVEIDSGGYDPGGSYWGLGEPLWCAYGEADEGEYCRYVRAPGYRGMGERGALAKLGISSDQVVDRSDQVIAREILHGLIRAIDHCDLLDGVDADRSSFAPSALRLLEDTCQEFVAEFNCLSRNPELHFKGSLRGLTVLEVLGRDLWLAITRNHSGFYDHRTWDWEATSPSFSWTHNQGNIALYLGDDGLIYVSGEENYGEEIA